jgi:hypothetical protein
VKYVVFLPASYTGGPFALLQLSDALTKIGHESQVVCYNKISGMKLKNNTISISYSDETNFGIANLKPKVCHSFDRNDVIILPEVQLDLLKQFVNMGCSNCVFWWLSWDNAPLSKLTGFEAKSALKNAIHIFQSHYAQIQASKLGFHGPIVSDYTFFEESIICNDSIKTNDICFLPRKSIGTDKIVADLQRSFSIIRIENMSQSQVQDVLARSKYFIDFGNHPGKDRIPREAAIANCIPIVRREGAARYMEDVFLPKYLKIELEMMINSDLLVEHINKIELNRPEVLGSIEPYKRKIKSEKSEFISQVQDFCELYFA